MIRKKGWRMMVLAFALVFLLAACAANDEGDQGEANQTDNGDDGHSEHDIDSFMHIHGLAYDPSQTEALYLATHHGLIHIDADSRWQRIAEEDQRHDLMGFSITTGGQFISSGHPAESADLADPLGIIISDDQGQTWEPIALHGEIDFHVMEVNAGDATHVYGLNTYGADQGLYRSTDGGKNWEKMQGDGLPDDLNGVYTMISHPADSERILAGTVMGLLSSTDGGQSWSTFTVDYSMTGANAIGNKETIIAYLVGEQEGLYRSEDFGESWESLNLKLEKDAAFHIAVDPQNPDTMTIGTYEEHLYRTKDGGDTWEQLANGGKPVHGEDE